MSQSLFTREALRSWLMKPVMSTNPSGISLFKVNNGNNRTMSEINSKLKVKTPERHQWRRSGAFIVNFEMISHVLVFSLLPLNKLMLVEKSCHLLETKNGHPHKQISVFKTNGEIDTLVFLKFCISYYKNVGYVRQLLTKTYKLKWQLHETWELSR